LQSLPTLILSQWHFGKLFPMPIARGGCGAVGRSAEVLLCSRRPLAELAVAHGDREQSLREVALAERRNARSPGSESRLPERSTAFALLSGVLPAHGLNRDRARLLGFATGMLLASGVG
jgi:hypothetical protein